MYMRIIWGRIVAGQWDGFEAAYKKATSLRGGVKGLKNQWLARDQADPDAGYSITLWESEADMRAFWDSKKREEAIALLRPFFLNQFTVTQCEVVRLHMLCDSPEAFVKRGSGSVWVSD